MKYSSEPQTIQKIPYQTDTVWYGTVPVYFARFSLVRPISGPIHVKQCSHGERREIFLIMCPERGPVPVQYFLVSSYKYD